MAKPIKEEASELYNVIEKIALNKKHIASLLYEKEWVKNDTDSTNMLTMRFKHKYDGKGVVSYEELDKLCKILLSFSKQLNESVENFRKRTRKEKILRLLEDMDEGELENLTKGKLKE